MQFSNLALVPSDFRSMAQIAGGKKDFSHQYSWHENDAHQSSTSP